MENDQAPLLGRAGHARTYRHHGHSPIRSKQATHLAMAAVLLAEMFERIAFYGVVGSLVMFLNGSPFNWSSYNATNALFVFTGISYMSSLLGGWIADAWCGKFRTIIFFFVVYTGGFVFFPLLYPEPRIYQNVTKPPDWCSLSHNKQLINQTIINSTLRTDVLAEAVDPDGSKTHWYPLMPTVVSSEACSWAVYLALVIMGIGNGAVKANISPFGADQVKHKGPAAIRMFVNWFYWCINLGALLSLGGLAYLQQEISFFWGYIATNISLVIAMVIFATGGCVYIQQPVGGSILTNIFKVIHQSCQKICCYRKPTTYGLVSGTPEALRETPDSCLDYAKIHYGGTFHDNMVEDVKKLGKICIIFLAMIPYWIVYFQMETTFVLQGLHMRLDLNLNGTRAAAKARNFKFPVAWLSLFDVVFLIILLPLFDRVIYPKLDRHGYVLSPRIRIIIGMVFAMCAVATAGFIEMYRLNVYWRDDTPHVYWQVVGSTFYRAADVSILLQIPQYALIGISEVFASVAGLEVAYVLAPHTMQGLITGLFWFTQGIGALLGSGILQAFRGTWFFSWDYGDINCRHLPCPVVNDPDRQCTCHLDYYFFLLAGVQLLGIIVFALITCRMEGSLRSMYNRNNNMEDSLSPDGPVDDSDRVVPGGASRPGYRTFARRTNVVHRSTDILSETDTLDTDNNSDYR